MPDRPPRRQSGGPLGPPLTTVALPPPNDQAPACIVARRWRPSTYSLSPGELAAHIRWLRRQGWQGWEIRARFDTEWAA
jgi:hypothetical protein